MSQEIKVVKCFKCETYQSQIAKKSKHWVCVVCGEKQSLKFSYGTGTGKDCRMLVQKLNEEKIQAADIQSLLCEESEDENVNFLNNEQKLENSNNSSNFDALKETKISKWQKYLDDEENLENA